MVRSMWLPWPGQVDLKASTPLSVPASRGPPEILPVDNKSTANPWSTSRARKPMIGLCPERGIGTGNTRTMARSRRRWRLLLALLFGVGLLAGLWAWWTDHRYNVAMEAIEAEVVAGRYALACRNLDNLLSWCSDSNGGITYLLGSCELARGRNAAASEAWARVAPGSAFSDRAIRGRLRLIQDSGQFAAAEQFIHDAARDRRNDGTALHVLLVPMYIELGRDEEAGRLIEERWEHLNARGEGALEPAIKLLQQHIDLTTKTTPVEVLRPALDRAARLAADDDRIWLGRANLAIRTGAYEEAGRLLDACQQRRPDDAAIWRARRNWGLATNRIDVVEQAMTHLPPAASTPADRHRVDAWLASRRGDREAERRALELLLAAAPADLAAIDRLAQLADASGQPDRAAELRRQKAEIDQLLARYKQLHERNQPIRHAVALATLAQQLGRPFESRGFLTIAVSEDPDRHDLRQKLKELTQGPATVAERSQAGVETNRN